MPPSPDCEMAAAGLGATFLDHVEYTKRTVQALKNVGKSLNLRVEWTPKWKRVVETTAKGLAFSTAVAAVGTGSCAIGAIATHTTVAAVLFSAAGPVGVVLVGLAALGAFACYLYWKGKKMTDAELEKVTMKTPANDKRCTEMPAAPLFSTIKLQSHSGSDPDAWSKQVDAMVRRTLKHLRVRKQHWDDVLDEFWKLEREATLKKAAAHLKACDHATQRLANRLHPAVSGPDSADAAAGAGSESPPPSLFYSPTSSAESSPSGSPTTRPGTRPGSPVPDVLVI